jgi:hypothetical protein
MAKKKSAPKKKIAPKKKTASKKKIVKRAKPALKKISLPKKKPVRGKKKASSAGPQVTGPIAIRSSRGLGSAAGGQSGDLQGLSRWESIESESVEELVEEGQSFEAEVVSGIENAKDPDEGEVTTSEVPEDDVPGEYDDRDKL